MNGTLVNPDGSPARFHVEDKDTGALQPVELRVRGSGVYAFPVVDEADLQEPPLYETPQGVSAEARTRPMRVEDFYGKAVTGSLAA